jgi:hypothetical protein
MGFLPVAENIVGELNIAGRRESWPFKIVAIIGHIYSCPSKFPIADICESIYESINDLLWCCSFRRGIKETDIVTLVFSRHLGERCGETF